MPSFSKIAILSLMSALVFCGGCIEKTVPTAKPKTAKTKLAQAELQSSDVPLLAESTITYNYTPVDYLDDNLLQNLVLSENKSYQLKTANGSGLPEQVTEELEKLALVWDEKDEKVDEMLNLWREDGVADFSKPAELELVYFDPQGSEIAVSQQSSLEQGFKLAQKALNKGQKVLVRGHSDPSESSNKTFELSFDRAKAVKDELVKMGLDASSISIVAVGDAESVLPACQDKDMVGFHDELKVLRALNCRAEIVAS
jgi:outer membrane protein OmpA-like peptidoglycan-associated protein